MSTIPISQIIIAPDRQRREFKPGAIEELAESMRTKGLMHPVVVLGGPDWNSPYTLVAGERRLRAAQLLGWTEISYTCLDDLDEYGRREAELEENIRRVDLTWQEKGDAIAKLHALRKEKNPGQTNSDTAREVYGDGEKDVSSTRKDEVAITLLVDQFKDDPEVRKAKSLRDAGKIVERKLRGEFAQAMRDAQEALPEEQKSRHTLLHGACQYHFAHFEPGQFNCIIADPPYGMNADEFGDAAKGTHEYDDSPEYAREIMTCILEYGSLCTTDDAHLYMFCDLENFSWLVQMCDIFGWQAFRTPLVWAKGSSGHIPWGPNYWRRGYEFVLFARKDSSAQKPLSRLASDILSGFPSSQEKDHAAEKPVELYKHFLELSCFPGDRVLDPCCGSGTIFPAADAVGVTATGIEADEETWRLALSRLQNGR